MERHEGVVDRLHGAAPPLLHNVASLDFDSVNLLTHTAHCVQDKAQAGGWGDVQQPGKQVRDPVMGVHIFLQPLVSQLPQGAYAH